jgi:hypothetical protein
MSDSRELIVRLRIDLDVTVNDRAALTEAARTAVNAADARAGDMETGLLEVVSTDPVQAIINAMGDPCDLLIGLPGIEYARSVISPAADSEVTPRVDRVTHVAATKPANDALQPWSKLEGATHFLRDSKSVTGIDFVFQYESDDDPGTEPTVLTEDFAPIIKGMLWAASTIVIDELFADVETLRGAKDIDEDVIDSTMIISGLPQIYRSAYTALFAQQFLVAAVDVSRKLIQWEPLSSEAEELALYCFIDQVDMLVETLEFGEKSGRGGLISPTWRDSLTDMLFEDSDMLMLWTTSNSEAGWKRKRPSDEEANTAVRSWFEPFRAGIVPSPYAGNQSE